MCACVSGGATLSQRSMMVQQLSGPLRTNNRNLFLEVAECLQEKAKTFVTRNLATARALIDAHAQSKGGHVVLSKPKDKASSALSELEADAFKLMMKELDYDIACYDVFKGLLQNFEIARLHEKLEWRNRAFKNNVKAAQEYLENNATLILPGAPEDDEPARKLNELVKQMQHKFRLAPENVVVAGFANWVAPSVYSGKDLDAQQTLLGALINQNDQNIGLATMPIFTYKRGQLWQLENAQLETMARKYTNIDRTFTLLYQGKPDKRDGRPLGYPGRVITPVRPNKDYIWSSSNIVAEAYTDKAEQLASKEMKLVEDLDPGQVPLSTDDATSNVQGAAKFKQLGIDGMMKMFEALLQNSGMNNNHVLIIVDTTVGVGDLFDAFVNLRESKGYTIKYFGMFENPMHLDWFQQTKSEYIADLFGNDKVTIPGFTKVPVEPPEDVTHQGPARPALKRMVWRLSGQGKDEIVNGVIVPFNLVSSWTQHDTFGPEFRRKLDSLVEKYDNEVELSTSDDAQPAATTPSPKSGTVPNLTPQKTKVSPDKIVDASSLTGDDLLSVPLHSLKLSGKKTMGNVTLSVKPGYKISIINSMDVDVEFSPGTLLVNFGLGKFKNVKSDEIDWEKNLLFAVVGSEDHCIYQNKLTTVGMMYYGKLASTSPQNAKVCYHSLAEVAGKVQQFTCTREHHIVFVPDHQAGEDGDPDPPAPEGGEKKTEGGDKKKKGIMSQSIVGAMVPATKWRSHATELVWTMKWHATGLMPVKPNIVFMASGTIPAKKALLLS